MMADEIQRITDEATAILRAQGIIPTQPPVNGNGHTLGHEHPTREPGDDWAPPLEPGDEDEQEIQDPSWQQVDLAAIVAGLLDGTLERPTPTVGLLDDGTYLFYPGRVNGLFGESGDGKTWVALYTCRQELELGHHVIYLDYEDRSDGIVGRLLDLGTAPDLIVNYFHYIAPDEPYGLAAQVRVAAMVRDLAVTLVVIDSTGESMSVDGTKPNADDEVARWGRRLPAALAKLGPAVELIDHVTKSKEDRGLYQIGSQRKRGMITGAVYMVEMVVEFGQGKAGISKLIVAKDRGGTRIRGHKAADFHLDSRPAGLVCKLAAPAAGTASEFKPTALMEKVSRYVELNPGATRNNIEKAKLGKTDFVRVALDQLVADGSVVAERHGQALAHTVTQPYRRPSDDDGRDDTKEDETW